MESDLKGGILYPSSSHISYTDLSLLTALEKGKIYLLLL